MPSLIKPPRLRPGDIVATVSLSWGGAGDENILWRYQQGKARLETRFGLRVVEMPHTLAGTAYAYEHPQERAADLMQAFTDPCIQAIFCCIGGEETIRLLPYIDFAVIRRHPKIFMGYSDTTVNHLMCWKAGLSSFYGPAVLSDFAENLRLPAYTEKWVKKALFSPEPLGQVEPAGEWTAEFLRWDIENQKTARRFQPNGGYRLLQGSGTVTGRLLGGCLEVFDWLRGTPLFFPSTTGNAAAFSSALPEMPAAAFLFSDNVCAGQSLLFCRRAPRAGQSRAGVAHRTQAVWREEFSRHSAPQPGVRTGRPTADFPRRGVCCKPLFICPFVF